jgi:16S rRNA (adenine1518-N6/adenine1519-N6)-dimethyltransferase
MYKKKSLGQHFLHSVSYLNAVADAAHIQEGETVLEIGPGEGALTAVLLERGAQVVAIEKDTRLIPLLKEKFADRQFKVIEADALEFDTADLKTKKFKVVGNVPYYITGALFKKFLSCDPQPTTLVFLVQKEVAERIARSKKESILSLSVKAYGTPKYVKTVPAGAFSPPPKVDSAILVVNNVSRDNFTTPAHEERFFEAVKKGFAQKRKFLKNNLGAEFAEAFEHSELPEKVRAEDVPLAKYLDLSRA